MIKRILSRRIIVATSALFALLLIYMIPKDTGLTLKNVKSEINYVEQDITKQVVYLLNQNEMLSRTKIVTKKDATPLEQVRSALSALIKDGPSESKIPNGFRSVLPSDTKILSLDLNEGVLKVNFSKELLEVDEKKEEKMIEAITYTATSTKEVKYVIIYVEGDILSKLPKSGTILPSTLDRSFGINKQYDIDSTANISQVTVYYINQYNEEYYYVPVTKYLNDDREKIKIIIDELTSSNIYQTNLMSFLNSNAKLLDVKESEGILALDFNPYIFNDETKKDILEEVIYTICLSVGDNYDVNSVVFQVEKQEIYKSVLKTIE